MHNFKYIVLPFLKNPDRNFSFGFRSGQKYVFSQFLFKFTQKLDVGTILVLDSILVVQKLLLTDYNSKLTLLS